MITIIIQSVREVELKSLHGRKIAIDASMAIYQFLIAVRAGGPNQQSFQLTNDKGETTSHIQGMFNRTVRYMQEGIKPVFVFDGKPPQLKSGELLKRREKREKAQAALKVAAEEGDVEELDKQSKRLVRAGTQENADCQKLLDLMGVPVVRAPCEAEAQAAALAKRGTVYATATEDMDALTFATPVLVRKMTFAGASKSVVQSISYAKAVEGLELTHAQFVDLCILLGCDYCDSIKGVGPKTALKLIKEHGDIETILTKLEGKKYVVPESWLPAQGKPEEASENDEESPPEQESAAVAVEPAYVQARRLFQRPRSSGKGRFEVEALSGGSPHHVFGGRNGFQYRASQGQYCQTAAGLQGQPQAADPHGRLFQGRAGQWQAQSTAGGRRQRKEQDGGDQKEALNPNQL